METTLFNKKGKPVAYIADDRETIYLWEGMPVAYLEEDRVYGWNGKQLGWFVNDTLFDVYGLRSGFTKKKSPIATEIEPPKLMKQRHEARKVKQHQVVKPALCYGYSAKSLEELLTEGQVA